MFIKRETLCVKLHTVCKIITECKSSFTFIVKKFPSLEIFYAHAVADVADKYEVSFQGQFYGMLTEILAVPNIDSELSSDCQFFVEPIIAVASEDTQYRCFVVATNP